MFKKGDLIKWNHHGPDEGKICKIKEVYGDKFTLEKDPYIDHHYDLSTIRHATDEDIRKCEFF